MLNFNLNDIGNALYKFRKSKGFTQAEVAEKSDLSDRTYADIERGNVTMRIDSLIKICNALAITPNDIFDINPQNEITEQNITDLIKNCSENEKATAFKLLSIYINSL